MPTSTVTTRNTTSSIPSPGETEAPTNTATAQDTTMNEPVNVVRSMPY
ncbi:hypothetical protein [Streptomyces sp. NBC_00091]|nr:hypothetical protein [Streptomyces sp. NBC_00091]MCX5374916.1 hypothetical protein [Streptomyces sp. NBC_00091]MCX5380251.1 hypothetical protein [Streptomyces sp. NBC_00091]